MRFQLSITAITLAACMLVGCNSKDFVAQQRNMSDSVALTMVGFAEANKRLPASFDELAEHDSDFSETDAWDTQLSYVRHSDSHGTIVSAGPDLRFGTMDDISVEFSTDGIEDRDSADWEISEELPNAE